MNPKPRPVIICKCNIISQETIQAAIEGGCKTLNEIFDATNAGVGPCGGSCRRILKTMLDKHLEDQEKKNKVSGT